MSRTIFRAAAAFVATATLAVLPVAITSTAQASQPYGYGPSDPFDDALMGDTGPVIPLKNQAMIKTTDYGLRFIAGQQNSHLTVTLPEGKLRFHDTGSQSWKALPATCTAQRVEVGVAATCDIPASTSETNPTLIEVWPRLGNDYIDLRTLPAVFESAVLSDAGRDTVFTGDGNDFINGAQDLDRVHGGAGNDWIRTGNSNDQIWGDAGNDYMVGAEDNDTMHGGTGDDRVAGATGNDILYGDEGTDNVRGESGTDTAYIDDYDRTNSCETVLRLPL